MSTNGQASLCWRISDKSGIGCGHRWAQTLIFFFLLFSLIFSFFISHSPTKNFSLLSHSSERLGFVELCLESLQSSTDDKQRRWNTQPKNNEEKTTFARFESQDKEEEKEKTPQLFSLLLLPSSYFSLSFSFTTKQSKPSHIHLSLNSIPPPHSNAKMCLFCLIRRIIMLCLPLFSKCYPQIWLWYLKNTNTRGRSAVTISSLFNFSLTREYTGEVNFLLWWSEGYCTEWNDKKLFNKTAKKDKRGRKREGKVWSLEVVRSRLEDDTRSKTRKRTRFAAQGNCTPSPTTITFLDCRLNVVFC